MQVINKNLTQAIHVALENIPYEVKITIVQARHEHNIPWHFINEDYLFKVESKVDDWYADFRDVSAEELNIISETKYAKNPKQLANIIRSKLCRSLGCCLMEHVAEYEADTGEVIWMPGCPEDEVLAQDGHDLIVTVQMLDWHYENERRADDPFWGREEDDLIEVPQPIDRNAPF